MAVYTNDLRLTELATGEGSGTWGTTTNTNLSLIADSFGFGTEAITTNADTHTTTIADGSADAGRAIFLKYTGTLDSTCTITIGPNTVSKLWFIENATSGSQSIIIKQGSGATVTIANGQTKAIYSDGAGSGGAMVDAFTDLSVPSLFVSGDLDVDGTTNLDVVDIDGAVDFASTTAHAGNASFADNARVILGTGSDLQLYHDGSHSYIEDAAGTGNLKLRTNTLRIENAAGTELSATFVQDGAVTLYNDNSIKLATTSTGIDVTGVITTDGMTTSADVNFGDDDKAVFGAGSDLVVFHESSTGRSFIKETGSDEFRILGSDIRIKNGGDSKTYMQMTDGGSVAIRHNDSTKLETSSTGINVTGTAVTDGLTVDGTATITTADNTAQLTLVSTDADASVGPLLTMSRASGSPADNDAIGELTFNFNNDAAESTVGTRWRNFIIDASDGTEDVAFDIFSMKAGALTSIINYDSSTLVFNDGSADIDFRVESDSNTHMLFVDAGNDGVGIGNSSPSSFSGDGDNLVVGTTSGNNGISIISATDGSGNLYFGDTETTGGGSRRGQLVYDHATDSMRFATAVTERMRIDSSGNVGIGTSSPDNLLHVYKGASGHSWSFDGGDAFIVESNDSVSLNIATPASNSANILFSDANARGQGRIIYDHGSDYMGFHTAGISNERMRIDSSGTLIVQAGNKIQLNRADNARNTQIFNDNSFGTIETSNDPIKIASQDYTAFFVSGSEKARLTSDGRLGIGTSSPGRKLTIDSGHVRLSDDYKVEWGGGTNYVQGSNANNRLIFATNNSEGFRLDSSGNLLVGTASADGDGLSIKPRASGGGTTTQLLFDRANSTETGFALVFHNNSTLVGSITYTNSATAFNTSSDQRLKDNIVNAPSASADIDAIQVRSFDWKGDGLHQKYGMVAQELQSVAPEAVTGNADSDEMMGVDYSKLVPMMMKEIQSLRARVAQLEGEN